MKFIKFIVASALMFGIAYLLNTKTGSIPPLGKLLDPFHGFWQNAGEQLKEQDQSFALPGLQAEASVSWDKNRVPHIIAQNNHDLFYLQGYIHARDRLWQMDIETRLAGGKLSEAVGKSGLKTDRFFRRIGMVYGAKKMVQQVRADATSNTILSAYCDGVNQYISQLSYADYPVEFKLMDYKPEPWTMLKTALLVKFMAFDLAWRDDDLAFTKIREMIGAKDFERLFPDFPGAPDPIIPKGSTWDFPAINLDSILSIASSENISMLKVMEPNKHNGSNDWAVAGSKTESGAPILCNDPHLGLNLPSLWYQVQLSAPGINVYGVSLAGAPTVIIGFNDSISLGMTYAARDVKDWYKITFEDASRQRYLFDGVWKNTRIEVDTYHVKGGADFIDTLVFTHQGPVAFDRSYPGDTTLSGLAVRWTAHDPSNELLALYHLNKAHNTRDYLNAIPDFACPGQNFVYADRNGNIAIFQQGKFPLKWKEQGKFILDGSQSKNDWHGMIPQKQNPHIINPDRGFVSSANQHPTDSTYPYYYTGDFEYYRNQEINNLLRSNDSITPRWMMQMQNNNGILLAKEVLPLMLDMLKQDENAVNTKQSADMLAAWNRQMDASSKAATIWHLWWYFFYRLTWDEFNQKEDNLVMPETYITASLLLNHPDDRYFDLINTEETETAKDIAQLAFTQARDSLDRWISEHGNDYTWSKFKSTRLTHLSQTLHPFDVGGLEIGGGTGTINATTKTHGPSWRMIVAMDPDSIRAWGIYPGGQSGNPGSRYYDNWAKPWAAGKYNRIVFLPSGNSAVNTSFTEIFKTK